MHQSFQSPLAKEFHSLPRIMPMDQLSPEGVCTAPGAKWRHGACCARVFWIAARACLASPSFGFKLSAILSSFSASSNSPVLVQEPGLGARAAELHGFLHLGEGLRPVLRARGGERKISGVLHAVGEL